MPVYGRVLVALGALVSVACASDGGASSSGSSGGSTSTASAGTSTGAPVTTAAGTSSGAMSTSSTGSGTTTTTTSSTGSTTTGSTSGGSGSTGNPPGQRVLFAVGYGGIRVRSLDDGQTWQDYVQLADGGGDDMNLLRGAAWGGGQFVAAGWRIFSSPDGVQWQEHPNPTGQWFGAVAYGNGQFLGAGGGGYCGRSADAVTWEKCTDVTDDAGFTHVRSVLFHAGLFWTADANGVVRSSPDGDAWTVEQNIGSPWIAVVDDQIVTLGQTAPADFPDLRLRGGNHAIGRADAGSSSFQSVFDIPNANNVFQAFRFAFAEGWVGG